MVAIFECRLEAVKADEEEKEEEEEEEKEKADAKERKDEENQISRRSGQRYQSRRFVKS